MPSLVIRRFMYVPDAKELTIEFVTGRRYVYSGVAEDDVHAFRSAFSKGAHSGRRLGTSGCCNSIR